MDTRCSICNRAIPRTEPARILEGNPACRDCADERDPRCPHCYNPLAKRPARKTKCRSCGKPVLVRSQQMLFPSAILTENQAFEVDWIVRLESCGVSLSDYLDVKREMLSGNQKWSAKDLIWGALNRFDCGDDLQLTWQKACFLHEGNRDASAVLRIYNERQAARLKILDIEHVTIDSRACCVECRGRHGERLSLESVLKDGPLPQACCTRRVNGTEKYPFCICGYTLDDDCTV